MLLIPTLLLVVGLALFLRLWRAGGLQDALAYLVYLHGRRTRFAGLFVVMTTAFVLAGVVGTLGMMGAFAPSTTDALSAPAFLVGSLALLFILWWGLRPSPTTHHERAVIDGEPNRLYTLGVVDRTQSKR